MSEEATTPQTYESQQDRWIKYGGNVALVSVIVIALAVLLIWLFDRPRFKARTDTTTSGLYSLKPQTINIIRNNKTPVRIISLYTKPKPNPDATVDEEPPQDYMGPVADLLQEYERKGAKIEVEIIDPVEQVAKVDQLINEVTEKYGGEIAKYKKFINDFMPPAENATAPPTTRPIYSEFRQMADAEAKHVTDLFKSDRIEVSDRDLAQSLMLGVQTIGMLPRGLEKVKADAEKKLKQKPPDYKGVVDALQGGMEATSSSLDAVIRDFERAAADKDFKGPLKDYVVASVPRYKELKKRADDTLAKINALGELKLDQLRSNLRERDAILVMGPDEWRSLPFDRVWQPPLDARNVAGKPKRKFAGEQQVTSAILAVTSTKTKQKVAFVRGGGPPLIAGGGMFGRGPSFAYVAERLREYNFEVLEKDLSGMWAMQAQMQRMPAAPEPSDEEIKDAIWIVYASRGQSMMGGPSLSIAPRIAAHLESGGSALIIPTVRGEDLAEALGPWGIKVNPNAIVFHAPIEGGAASADEIEEAFKQLQYVFITNDFGDHAIARPIKGLDGVLLPVVPVTADNKADRTVTRILPITFPSGVWGETNIDGPQEGPAVYNAPTGNKPGGDVPPPLWGGAVSEKPGGGRVVVLGAQQIAQDEVVTMIDPVLRRKNIIALRFPANGELFMNSVFWLAKQDTMIAISASALDTNRVKDVSPGAMTAWRSLLLAVVPLAVIVAGAMVYFARRD